MCVRQPPARANTAAGAAKRRRRRPPQTHNKKNPPKKAELADLSLAAQRLFDLDDQRLAPHEYALNLQAAKHVHTVGDEAPALLFAQVDKAIWDKRTFLIFYHVLDNYERCVFSGHNCAAVASNAPHLHTKQIKKPNNQTKGQLQ